MSNYIERYFLKFLICCFLLLPLKSYSKSILEITDNDFFIGNNDAPITIIEYASLSCSHCADFHIKTLPKIIEEYVDTGIVKMVFRDFPLNYPALLGSMLLRCVSEDIRFQYQDAFYQLQSKWVLRDSAKSTQELYKIMQSGGMKKDDFDKCIKNTDLEKEILEGLMLAQSEFNIKSTPSFIINGQLLGGNKPIKDFRQIIQKILSQ